MSLTDRSTLRRAANVLGVVVLIALVAPFVVYGVPQVVGADESFVVLSGSMEPAISPGDVVVVRDAAVGSIAAGDIITYRTDSATPTTHRVIEVVDAESGPAYRTKGDANEDPDSGLVAHDRVIGTVFLTIPLLGHAVMFLNTPVGFAAVVVVPLVLLVGSELWSLVGSISAAETPEATSAARSAPEAGEEVRAGAVDVETDSAVDGDMSEDSGDGSAADTDATEGETAADAGGASLTLTRSSLQLIALLFAVYLPYSAYVAYELRTSWAITMAIATAIGLLFVVGIHSGSPSAHGDGDGTAGTAPETDDDGGDASPSTPEFDADPNATSDPDDSGIYPASSTAADGGADAPSEELVWQEHPADPASIADDDGAAAGDRDGSDR